MAIEQPLCPIAELSAALHRGLSGGMVGHYLLKTLLLHL